MAHSWRPTASIALLRQRAEAVRRIHRFFETRAVCEVHTPVLSKRASAEPALRNLAVTSGGNNWYLRTSPESAMKRLLAAGSGDIYQLGPVFRAEERGRLHLTEFTLLEWYREGFDHHDLMDEVSALLADLGYLHAPARVAYRDLFAHELGADPHALSNAELAALARERADALPVAADDRAMLFDALYVAVLEPALSVAGAVLLHDFPCEQRAYARLSTTQPPTAERFELIIDGIEIANGYHEIVDAEEQRECFARENAVRRARGLEPAPPDDEWLAALRAGVAPCAGVALGLERLLLALHGLSGVDTAASFGHELD